MRTFLALLTTTVALAAAPLAQAQDDATAVPPPSPTVIKLGHTPVVQLTDGGGGLPYLASPTSINAGALIPALKNFHDSGVYLDEIAQVDAIAHKFVRSQTKHHSAKHASKHRKPAIVFDVDETSLSNYTAIVADDFTYGTNSLAEVDNEIGTAIAPTLDLYNYAVSRGVTPFFITGRNEGQRAHTESNLKREGYADWAQLVLKPIGYTGTTVQYKSGARAAIEQQGYHVIASVGDQYSDLAGGHEDEGFKLPNPFYYLP